MPLVRFQSLNVTHCFSSTNASFIGRFCSVDVDTCPSPDQNDYSTSFGDLSEPLCRPTGVKNCQCFVETRNFGINDTLINRKLIPFDTYDFRDEFQQPN